MNLAEMLGEDLSVLCIDGNALTLSLRLSFVYLQHELCFNFVGYSI